MCCLLDSVSHKDSCVAGRVALCMTRCEVPLQLCKACKTGLSCPVMLPKQQHRPSTDMTSRPWACAAYTRTTAQHWSCTGCTCARQRPASHMLHLGTGLAELRCCISFFLQAGWADTDYAFNCMDYSVMMADLNDPAGNCSLSAAGTFLNSCGVALVWGHWQPFCVCALRTPLVCRALPIWLRPAARVVP